MGWLETITFKRAATIVGAICLLVYGANVTHSFVWDDGYNVVENEAIRDLSNIPSFFTEAWGASADSSHSRSLNTNYWRPVALASYAIDYALYGLDAGGFHATNVLLHTLCSIMVLLLGWRLFPSEGRERLGVVFAAMIFAVHPVHTEVVSVITYRTDILAALFSLWALVTWMGPPSGRDDKQRLRAEVGWVPLLYFLGVGSKEMAFTVPILIALYELFVRRATVSQLVVRLLPLGVVALGYLLIRMSLLEPSTMVYFDINWPTHLPAGLEAIVLTMLSVCSLYAKLIILPWPLNPFYDWSPDVLPVQNDLLEPSVLMGLIVILAWAYAATRLAKNDRRLLFLWLMLPILLIPVSHVVPIIIAAGERFLYLAVIGPVLVGTVLLFRRFGSHPILVSLLCALTLTFGLLTAMRNHDWRSDEAILEAYVADWPGSYNAWRGLARLRIKEAKQAASMGQRNVAAARRKLANEAWGHAMGIYRQAWAREADKFHKQGEEPIATCVRQALSTGLAPDSCLGGVHGVPLVAPHP